MRKLLENPYVATAITLIAVIVGAMVLLGGNQSSSSSDEDLEDFSMASPSSVSGDNLTYMTKDEIGKALKLTGLDLSTPDPFNKSIDLKHEDLADEKAEVVATETYHLSAIWSQPGSTLLLINNRICASGERIGKLFLDTISGEGVWVIRNGDRSFLPMGETLTFASIQLKTE